MAPLFLASTDEHEIWVAQPELIDEVIVHGETYDVYEKGVAKPGVGQLIMTYEHFRQSDPNDIAMASYSITHYPITLKLFETMYTKLGFLCASHFVCRDTDQHYFHCRSMDPVESLLRTSREYLSMSGYKDSVDLQKHMIFGMHFVIIHLIRGM